LVNSATGLQDTPLLPPFAAIFLSRLASISEIHEPDSKSASLLISEIQT
jgi:hypothetical protein